MAQTSLSNMIGLTYPVFQAPMAGVSTPAMAAAVTRAGGLGALGLGASTPQAAELAMAEFRALCDGPLHANLFCHAEPQRDEATEAAWIARLTPRFKDFGAAPPEALNSIYPSFIGHQAMTQVLVEAAPGVVSFHFGLPDEDQIAALKAAGSLLMATAASVGEARAIEAAGLDAIIVLGWEAGGHRGLFAPDQADAQLPTLDLLAQVRAVTGLPLVAAGGLMDGHDVRRALEAGAEAAQLGTAFVACDESAADTAYRARLAAGGETVMTRAISGRPARCLTNGFTALTEGIDPAEVPDYPVAYDLGKALNAAAKAAGDGRYGAQWSGTGAERAKALPAGQIMAQLVAELVS
ncbi:nitronate monooxygenase [Brevundimonas sp.]|uniref:NAD(P)H-dependent flavin oxidoreductase n=1 Tax=Brevundimonas sp. TaxID=1871086 RepID=UPI0028A17412|nr:nitronate monooxygenase [Brevundimonas sp.]